MSGELNLKYSTEKTILALILGQDRTTRWNGSAMVSCDSITNDNWPVGMVQLNETHTNNFPATHTGTYVGNFPAGITTAGEYAVEYYLSTAATPGSPAIGMQDIWWNGSNLVSPASPMILTSAYDAAKTAGNATVANQTSILSAIQGITRNTARSTITGPTWFVRPATGTKTYRLGILLYNLQGILEDPDNNAVNVHARLADNTSMDGHLSATTLQRVAAGQYELLGYNVAGLDQPQPHPAEAVTFDFSWAIGGESMKDSYTVQVQDAESLETIILIKNKTDKIPDVPAAVGSAMTLQAAEREAIAAALLDLANTIDGKTLRQALQIVSAVLAGKVSGAGSGTETFRGLDDLHDRVVVTADAVGNRTEVAYS